MRNRIAEIRRQKEMTQKQLAKAAKTSQQQIQRIETGAQTASFELAARICAALSASMEEVFPTTKKPLAQHLENVVRLADVARKTIKVTEQPGAHLVRQVEHSAPNLKSESDEWIFEYRLRGGASGRVTVIGPECDRIFNAVQRTSIEQFVVFDAEDRCIALNLDHLLTCTFTYSRRIPNSQKDQPEDDRDTCELQITFADGPDPVRFEVERDSASLSDESASADESQLQHMIYMLDLWSDNYVPGFADLDNAHTFFRAQDVAMVSLPIAALEPRILDDEELENEE